MRPPFSILRWVPSVCVAAVAFPAAAQPLEVDPGSPRAAVQRFLERTSAGDGTAAAALLDLPPGADGPGLALRLRAVLDHHGLLDPDTLSPLPGGDPEDDLPPGTDRGALVPGPEGRLDPLLLVRRERGGEARWLVSRASVKRIDAWYEALPAQWFREVLPASLLRPGPFGILWWQWIALPILAVLAWFAGRLLGWLLTWLVRRAARRTRAEWDDALAEGLGAPLAAGWALGLSWIGLQFLGLPRAGETLAGRVVASGLLLVFFWALYRLVAVLGRALVASPWAASRPAVAGVMPFATRTLRAVVAAIAVIALLAQLGYPVASLLAGLGIGGIALALAGQKTVENLFGSVSISVDQPFRVGDFVKVEDFVAEVESVGLRSTRFRTLDRTLITIPNGRLAEMRTETYAARDRIRFAATVGLLYSTRAEQLRRVLAGFERVLRSHPRVHPDKIRVSLVQLGASSLDVEVMAWFSTTDWDEYLGIRQELLLQLLAEVEAAGTAVAFPTRTLHLSSAPSAGS